MNFMLTYFSMLGEIKYIIQFNFIDFFLLP